MWRYSVVLMLMISGCSNITFNARMCEEIASDPHAVMPKECRNYVEEDAQKAFDRTNQRQESVDDDIKFNKNFKDR